MKKIGLIGGLSWFSPAKGSQGTILGCSEIPMLISTEDLATPVFSTTEIHCRGGIDMALAA